MYILIWLLHGNRPTSPFLNYLLPTSVIYSLNAGTYSLRSTDMEKVHTHAVMEIMHTYTFATKI